MDLIPTGLDIESRLAAQEAESQRAPGELGQSAFLELLISQLANQDPLSPLQDHEFVAQLAQFSSLEQLESINEGMQASLLMNQSVNNSLATNLIGKEILASGDQIQLGESDPVGFRLELASDAAVTIRVLDSAGELVRTIEKHTLSAGPNELEWDGKTDGGSRAAAGDYTLEVVANDDQGNSVASQVQVRARVNGVRFYQGTGFLLVNGQEIPLSSVVEVLAPSGS